MGAGSIPVTQFQVVWIQEVTQSLYTSDHTPPS